jgi:proline iminopeptidase
MVEVLVIHAPVTRRRFCSLGLGAISLNAMAEGLQKAPPRTRISIRGTHLYAEDSGPRHAPALLYLHGGPGTGGYDFSLFQRARLSKSVRLIVIDERGVLRSDPITEGQAFGFLDLIEDCEALRRELHIDRWAVVGHSFGGYLALAYGLQYPRAITRLLFENPTFDFNTTGRYLLRLGAEQFTRLGKEHEAKETLDAAQAPESTPTSEVWATFSHVMNQLGKAKDDLYVHGPDKHFFDRLVAQSGLPSEEWQRGIQHQRLLFREGKVFASLTPRLPELKVPSLLIKGTYDPVTAPDQVDSFASRPLGSHVALFENSSHFVHVEEPDAFARAVTAFVLTGKTPEQQTATQWKGVPGFEAARAPDKSLYNSGEAQT